MKWDKALTLMVMIFIIVNIGLGLSNYRKYVNAYELSVERIGHITRLLEEKHIKLDTPLPRFYKPEETVWLEPLEIDTSLRNTFVKKILGTDGVTISKESSETPYEQNILIYRSQQKELRFKSNKVYYNDFSIQEGTEEVSEKQLNAYAEDFVDALELKQYFKKIKRDVRIESYGATITYYGVYNKLPVFDSYIRMEVTPNGVKHAEIKGCKVTEKDGQLSYIRPIDQVLFEAIDLIDQKVPVTIEKVELGYQLKNREGMHILEEEAVLGYKIVISGLSEPIFVNAYTK